MYTLQRTKTAGESKVAGLLGSQVGFASFSEQVNDT